MATAEQTATRRSLAQAVKLEQRRILTASLDDIRRRIQGIRERRRELMRRVRTQCKAARARTLAQAKARRAAVLLELRRELREMKQAERNRCALRRVRVAQESSSAAERARRELREQQRSTRTVERIEAHRRQRMKSHRAAEERRAESDDEVRQNLDVDLVPVFDVVKARVRARPGMSRTEAFLHWAEESPEQLWQVREDLAEAKLRALLREEQRAARELAKCGGRCTAKQRRAALPPAPF